MRSPDRAATPFRFRLCFHIVTGGLQSLATDETPVVVGIPVRNEVERLPRLLSALAAQEGAPHLTICLFFDNCDDGSAELVRDLAPTLPFTVATECCDAGAPPNAGAARARAMAVAERLATGGTLLTTDADSQPDPGWIAANLRALKSADIVAGRITRAGDRGSDMHDRVAAYYDRLHALRRVLDPVPWEARESHHWTSAASLAFRTATYRALGGFPPVPNGEDAAFADTAARAGQRLRRDAAAVVCTSGRRTGRAERGFAAALSRLDSADLAPAMAHPDDEAWRFRQHASARAAHHANSCDALAAALGLTLREIRQVAAECANGEAFAARIVGAPPGGMRTVPLAHAEVLLTALEHTGLEGAA